MSLEVRAIEDGQAWDCFVAEHDASSMCHLWAWRSVIQKTYGFQCVNLGCFERSSLVGVLPMTRIVSPVPFLGSAGGEWVSMPYLDRGGPLTHCEQVSKSLVDRALSLAADCDEPLSLRGWPGGSTPVQVKDRCSSDGESVTERLRMVLELPGDPEVLWSSFKGKVRNQVRKSERSGLETRRSDSSAVRDFYGVFARNMRDLGSPTHSLAFFENTLAALEDRCALFITRDEAGRPVAGGLAIHLGEEVVVPWASSLREARSLCANHNLYWGILRDSVLNGTKRFDFGRSWKDSGTFRFKQQWGARPIALNWYGFPVKGDASLANGTGSRDHPLLTGAWRRLPLPVANALGPAIRRYISN